MRFTGFCLVCTGTLFQALVGGFAAVLQQQEDAAALYAAQHAAHAYTFAPADEATEETRVCLMCVGELHQAAVRESGEVQQAAYAETSATQVLLVHASCASNEKLGS